jgi:deoxyribonuclease-4
MMKGPVIVHTGSCVDKEFGENRIADSMLYTMTNETSLTRICAKTSNRSIDDIKGGRVLLLENCAGEGNKIGKSLDEYKRIFDIYDDMVEELNVDEGMKQRYKSNVGVCIDTAHIFGAGIYDLGNEREVVKFFKEVDNTIGIDRLKAFHLNDSKVEFNSKKDRHQNLGLGHIFNEERVDKEGEEMSGLDGLRTFVDHAMEHGIPMIGEPPRSSYGGIFDFKVMEYHTHMFEDKHTDVYDMSDDPSIEFEC